MQEEPGPAQEELGPVVVVEDDPHIADLVAIYLKRDGFRTVTVASGPAALAAVRDHQARLAIVDIGLPGTMDGFALCRQLRQTSRVPVVMLTARDDEVDRILGLELGADDYVTKPFSPRELVARVRAVLRRSASNEATAEPTRLVLGDLTVDLRRREVRASGRVVELTTREFNLLAHLAQHRGMVLTRRQLLDGAWGMDWVGDERTVDVHVRQLRRKLGPALALSTLRGVGYRLD